MDSNKESHSENGSTLALITVFLAVIIGFASLTIDLARVYQQERDMQSATDTSALAAAALFTNPMASAASIIQEAVTVAAANGVSTNEITTSDVGTIEIGTWNTNTLTFAAATPRSQWNAVLVPAKRPVPLLFGRVLGTFQMTPRVQSVAMSGGLGSVSGLIPFGITTNELNGLQPGSILDTSIVSPGDRGKINLCGLNMSANPVWQQYMVSGVACAVGIGSQWDPGPGNAAFANGFSDRMAVDPYVLLPIVDAFPNGKSGQVTIEGFVEGLLLGSGGTWNGQIQLLNYAMGGTLGGPTNAPYAQVRVLVK
jgi:Flp pilus assembly protein TadG